MYFTVYILHIEFAIQLPVGKYENVPHSSYSSFLSRMELLVRTEVRHIINTNTQHYNDSNKHEDKQILHLYNFNPINNGITSILNALLSNHQRIIHGELYQPETTITSAHGQAKGVTLVNSSFGCGTDFYWVFFKNRTAIPVIRNMYVSKLATFQKYFKNLFVRENGFRQERRCAFKPP